MEYSSGKKAQRRCAIRAAVLLCACAILNSYTRAEAAAAPTVPVGAQYDSTHVYLATPAALDAFVKSFVATFGGKPAARITANVLPVPSSTIFQAVLAPVGILSVFAYQTPVPYPFGLERTGYLVTDMDQALKAARAAGAEVIVEKFKDALGYDAVIQWPGGVKMQLYWHFTPPSYAPLETIPDNRVYVSPDAADIFARSFIRFSRGKVVADEKQADAGEIGRRGATYRRIDVESDFGKMRVLVSDGHLPYPYGYELTGYEVKDLAATLALATAAGAKILAPTFDGRDRSTAIMQFPGGYIAEIHALRKQ